jgi:hypothetical protein
MKRLAIRQTGDVEVQQMSGYGSMSGEGHASMDQAKNDLAQKTGDVMDQAREQTGQAMDEVRGNAFQMMDQQKHRAADGLGSVASALRQTGDNLQNGDQGAIGQYANRAADTVDQLAQQIRDKSVDQLFSEAEQFARREPEIFLGGAVLLGLLASRFLKASARRSQMNRAYGNYGSSSQYGRGAGYQGDYGRMGPGGYDRGAWNDEGINYRSAGTGGYRTTISSGEGTSSYGEMSGSYNAGEMNADRGAAQRRSGAAGSQFEGETWASDEEDLPGTGAGSSQA